MEVNLAKYFVGLSGHLRSGATGHYEEFHKGLHDALQESDEFIKVSYLGSSLSEPSWFQPIVPPSLVSTGSWCNKHFRMKLQLIAAEKIDSIFHIYEGNLFQLFLLSEVLRKNLETRAILNLFDSARLDRILSHPLKRFLFRKFLMIGLRDLDGRLIVTADTSRMAEKIKSIVNIDIASYPMYSILRENEMRASEKKEYLFVIRGSQAMSNLIDSLKDQGNEFLQKTTVHGVPTIEQINFCENILGVSVSKKHLSKFEYTNFFKRFSHIVFLYDPELFRDQSSGRLCDALVAGAHVLVPKDSALWDSASEFGGFSEFEFDDVHRVIEIVSDSMTAQYPRTIRPLPEASRAVEGLVSLVNVNNKLENGRSSNLVFLITYSVLRKYQYILRIFTAIKIRTLKGILSS